MCLPRNEIMPQQGKILARLTQLKLIKLKGGIAVFGFWVFMLFVDLLVPVLMIGLGKLFSNKPPKNINALFGYRTDMSMKNQDTWLFAHHYCGKLWERIGWVLAPLSVLPMLAVFGRDIDTVATVGMVISFLQIVPMVGSIIPTEIALKKTFDKFGRRKKL